MRKAELLRRSQGIAHGLTAHPGQGSNMANRERASGMAANLGGHNGEHRLLGEREPGRDLRREATGRGPPPAAFHAGI